MQENKYTYVMTYREARKILEQKGVRVAVHIPLRLDVFVFTPKSSFLRIMGVHGGPVDSEGGAESFIYDQETKILHVNGGI